jgi:hypothetical protein
MNEDFIYFVVKENKEGFEELKALTVDATEKTIKAFGTIYVRSAATITPPHNSGMNASTILRSKKHYDILELRKVISKNIAGVEDPRLITPVGRPVPFRKLAGQWLAIDETTRRTVKPNNVFGFIVPTSWKKVRGVKPPETDPEQVYRGARWDGVKMVPAHWRRTFVHKDKLTALVKQQQQQAGKLISGWAPAARVFAEGKNIAAGFFEELGGKGFGKIYTDKKGNARGVMVNRQAYNAKLGRELWWRLDSVMAYTEPARMVQIKKIQKWYAAQAKKVLK